MQDYRKLKVWEKSHQVVLQVYQLTGTFPKEELYGLTSQIRRSAASIPSNIAEGCGRSGPGELARFLSIAQGSANELEYQLLLARDLNYLTNESFDNLSNQLLEVKQMLSGLIRKVRENNLKLS